MIQNERKEILYNILRSSSFVIFISLVIIVLIFTGVYLLFPTKFSSSPNITHFNVINTTLLVILLIALIIFLCWLFIPSVGTLFKFLGKLKGEVNIFLFIISLIIFFNYLNTEAINFYAFLIVPIVFLIAGYLFYKAITINTDNYFAAFLDFNKLKFSLIYLLFITFVIVMYIADPGKYISELFGPLATITFLLLIFGYIYFITFLSTPPVEGPASGIHKYIPILSGFQPLSILVSVFFVLFLCLSVYGLYVSDIPLNFSSGNSFGLALSIIFTIALLLAVLSNLLTFNSMLESGKVKKEQLNIWEYAKSSFQILAGIMFAGILSYWIYKLSTFFSSANNTLSHTISFIFNIILILSVFIIIYKLVSNTSFYKSHPLFRLIINTIFYLPCVIVNIIELVVNLFTSFDSNETRKLIQSTKDTPTSQYLILLFIILLYLFRFLFVPYFKKSIGTQGGTLLVNQPISTSSLNILGNYLQLNNIKEPTGSKGVNTNTHSMLPYNYNYAISFWVFIDSGANNRKDQFMSLINYGDVPNVLYNPAQNVLMVSVLNTGENLDDIKSNQPEKDYNGSLIVYKKKDVLLQKWNNIIVNYNGGTLDIFINGELVKSAINVVPLLSYCNLTTGEKNGITGGICNVVYFNRVLDIKDIYYIYNTNKDSTPPALINNSQTIIPEKERKQQPQNTTIDNPSITNILIPMSFKPDEDTNRKSLIQDQSIDNTDTDYLSLKWVFSNNGDNINGL